MLWMLWMDAEIWKQVPAHPFQPTPSKNTKLVSPPYRAKTTAITSIFKPCVEDPGVLLKQALRPPGILQQGGGEGSSRWPPPIGWSDTVLDLGQRKNNFFSFKTNLGTKFCFRCNFKKTFVPILGKQSTFSEALSYVSK